MERFRQKNCVQFNFQFSFLIKSLSSESVLNTGTKHSTLNVHILGQVLNVANSLPCFHHQQILLNQLSAVKFLPQEFHIVINIDKNFPFKVFCCYFCQMKFIRWSCIIEESFVCTVSISTLLCFQIDICIFSDCSETRGWRATSPSCGGGRVAAACARGRRGPQRRSSRTNFTEM